MMHGRARRHVRMGARSAQTGGVVALSVSCRGCVSCVHHRRTCQIAACAMGHMACLNVSRQVSVLALLAQLYRSFLPLCLPFTPCSLYIYTYMSLYTNLLHRCARASTAWCGVCDPRPAVAFKNNTETRYHQVAVTARDSFRFSLEPCR